MNRFETQVRVDVIHDEAIDIRSYSVSRIDGLHFDRYEAGAHIDVTSPSGITRQYSLCGDPKYSDSLLFAVKREAGSQGGSSSLHDDVSVGTTLNVGNPRNFFRLVDDATLHILVGAGIGITPLLGMAYSLVDRGEPFVLHYFARTEQHAAFLHVLSHSPFKEHVQLHLAVEPVDLDSDLAPCFSSALAGTHVYTCGPGAFMDRVTAVAAAYVAGDSIHLERFAANPIAENSPDENAKAFNVQIASTGQTVQVVPGTSIVSALAQIGVEVDTSCCEGICGRCAVTVLSGTPDHRDHCLSKVERTRNDIISCCVSRSESPLLVLDL